MGVLAMKRSGEEGVRLGRREDGEKGRKLIMTEVL